MYGKSCSHKLETTFLKENRMLTWVLLPPLSFLGMYDNTYAAS